MPTTAPTYLVRLGELSALRARVTELARPDERECAERLLGQLAALEAHAENARGDRTIEFVPHPTCAELAERASKALGAPPFAAERRRRFRRDAA